MPPERAAKERARLRALAERTQTEFPVDCCPTCTAIGETFQKETCRLTRCPQKLVTVQSRAQFNLLAQRAAAKCRRIVVPDPVYDPAAEPEAGGQLESTTLE